MPILLTEKALVIAFGEGDLAITIAHDADKKRVGLILYEDKIHDTEGKRLPLDAVPTPHVFIHLPTQKSVEAILNALKKIAMDTD